MLEKEDRMRISLANVLSIGLVAGIIGLAVYFFGFGQTFVGQVNLFSVIDESGAIGLVSFQSRFKNRRFLTHSVYLDVLADTPVTYQGDEISAQDAINQFQNSTIAARVGYRERKPGFGYVLTLDLEPVSSSPKENLLVISILLIFGCTAGMAVIAKGE
jgi:hypothetical protein